MNKRGAELTIGTLVIIVLAVIVLVVLVVGFTSGWGDLWANISQFFGAGANIDTVVSACNTACLTQGKNAFCTQNREVKLDNKKYKFTCNGSVITGTGLQSQVPSGFSIDTSNCPDICK